MDLTDNKYIENLIELMSDSDLSEIAIEYEKVKLTLKRDRAPAQSIVATVPSLPTQPQYAERNTMENSAPASQTESSTESEGDTGLHYITAPLVGTYYSALSPDAPPCVQEGEKIQKGQILCIVEAMKLMNEIESDVSGTLEEIMIENASPVEFGSKLFAIRIG